MTRVPVKKGLPTDFISRCSGMSQLPTVGKAVGWSPVTALFDTPHVHREQYALLCQLYHGVAIS